MCILGVFIFELYRFFVLAVTSMGVYITKKKLSKWVSKRASKAFF